MCPESFHWSTSQSGGPSLHSNIGQIDHQQLLAALPEQLPGHETQSRQASPAGRAGTRTSSASARYDSGVNRRVVGITISDRAADCTLQPGTGAAMIAHTVAEKRGRPIVVAGVSAVLVRSPPDGLSLNAWVGDRCSVSLFATKYDEDELLALFEHVDLASLVEPCEDRATPSARLGPI